MSYARKSGDCWKDFTGVRRDGSGWQADVSYDCTPMQLGWHATQREAQRHAAYALEILREQRREFARAWIQNPFRVRVKVIRPE